MKNNRFVNKTILIILFLLLSTIFGAIFKSSDSIDGVQVYFLDVGQGDSILIQKDNYQILIDGGPDDSVLPLLGEYLPNGDKKIETIILTHPHADHLIGINQVLDRYQVGTIYGTGIIYTSDQYLSFLQKIKDKKINFQIPKLEEKIMPFDFGEIEFLWPGQKYSGNSIDNLNNSSIVAKFCYYQNCAILTGDIERDEQDIMLDYYKNTPEIFRAAIYKVPHHGSNTGVNEKMYEYITPKYSIFSVGKDNKYGHPHNAAIEMAQKFSSTILRTDQNGTIKFIFGETLLKLIN